MAPASASTVGTGGGAAPQAPTRVPEALPSVKAILTGLESSELLNDGIVTTASVVLIGSFFWVPVGLYFVWRRKCKTRRRKALFLGCLIVLLMSPLPVGRRVTRLRLWDRFLRYFAVRAVGDVGALKGKQALYCLVPHGIFPFGIALSTLGRLNNTTFNDLRPVVASIMLRVPIIGHILRLIGAVRASPAPMDQALRDGHSLGLAPGGIGEIFLDGQANKEFALIKSHKGFVRRAMANGIPLVPVFVFGNSATFQRVPLPRVVETASRFLKASLVLFWGRWGLPVPFKVPLTFAFGRPIEVDRNPSPSASDVDALHSRFCEELTSVFDKFKGTHGWGDKHLELQ